jgi:hypothetical protein
MTAHLPLHRLKCDPVTGSCNPPPGVEMQPAPGFANAVSPGSGIDVFGRMIRCLEQLGWTQGVDIFAHAYDWRLTPMDWAGEGGDFHRLRLQMEGIVSGTHTHGRQPIVVVTLSLGAPYLSLFLNTMVGPGWKEAHVARFVSLSGGRRGGKRR